MAHFNCECEKLTVDTGENSESIESDDNSKTISDVSSGSQEKQDGAKSSKRKRRKKRKLTGVSRQRRAANARERRRIQGVNHAFVQLKNTLPLAQIDISKFEILRLAMQWIDHLKTLLKDHEEQKDLLNTKQMETSRPNDLMHLDDNITPVKHSCLYHQFPDLKNTLWDECMGLQGEFDYMVWRVLIYSQ